MKLREYSFEVWSPQIMDMFQLPYTLYQWWKLLKFTSFLNKKLISIGGLKIQSKQLQKSLQPDATVYPILLDQVLHYHILICQGWRRLLQLTGRFELGLGLSSLVWQRWTLAQYQLIGYLLFTCCRYLIGLRQCHWIIMIVGLLWMSLSLWWSSSVKNFCWSIMWIWTSTSWRVIFHFW